jgi:hypothetical protein
MNVPPNNLQEYRAMMDRNKASKEWVLATYTVEEFRKVLRSYDDGLLTPGDVLLLVADTMNRWADASQNSGPTLVIDDGV